VSLRNRRVVVTRPLHQQAEAQDLLRAAGAVPIALPAIAILPPTASEAQALRAAMAKPYACAYDWLLVTSANTAHAISELCALPCVVKVACVGTETERALEAAGISVDVVAKHHHAEGLIEALAPHLSGTAALHFLFPRAKRAREFLPDALKALGHRVDVMVAYETQPAPNLLMRWNEITAESPPEAVLFSSSSTALALIDALGAPRLKDIVLASIGPETTRTLLSLGLPVAVTAEKHSMAGLIRAIDAYFRLDGPGC
jgi:uroporphyrinogen-III synthase